MRFTSRNLGYTREAMVANLQLLHILQQLIHGSSNVRFLHIVPKLQFAFLEDMVDVLGDHAALLIEQCQ